ncbi:sensor histidine kinase [Nannocystaceae bacterium ST9]
MPARLARARQAGFEPNPDFFEPKADIRGPKRTPNQSSLAPRFCGTIPCMDPRRQARARQVAALDDLAIRLIGIPGFGVAIPNLTGLFGPLGPRDPIYWFGYAWFVGLAWAIWQGNRWLLFQQRKHLGWFEHPVQKLLLLLFAIVCYTAPLTVLWLVAWYGMSGFAEPDFAVIETTMLMNVICVVFVAHAYETVFLIKDRASDLLALERLDRARAQAQLDALRTQIDPHFLFNSLATLGHLIDTEPARARAFNDTLARVYRYILAQRDRDLVGLADELAFVRDYVFLLRLRFGEALELVVDDPERLAERRLIIPVSLQILVENAVKHTIFDAARPLVVRLELRDRAASVTNPRRPKPLPTTTGLGLANLAERYRLVAGADIRVIADAPDFRVELPLVSLHEAA